MGALQSLRENLPDVEEENSSDKLTPVRPTNKRLLSLDPRSPSETIERTPIVVEKTPMPGSSKVAVQQFTPVSGDRIDDPRSPTADFTRTPINPCLAGPQQQKSRLQATALDSLPSTTTVGSESGIESAEVTPVKDSLPGQSLESPDSAFSVDEAHSDGHNVAARTADSSAASLSDDDSTSRVPLMVESTVGRGAGDTPKLPALRARPYSLNKLSRLAMEDPKLSDSPAVTRSPLSNVANARIVLGSQQNKMRTTAAGDQLEGRSLISAGANKENCFR